MFRRFSIFVVALITLVISAGVVHANTNGDTNDMRNNNIMNQRVVPTPSAIGNNLGVNTDRVGPATTTNGLRNNTTFRTNNLRTNAVNDNNVDWGWLGLLGLLGLAGLTGRNKNPENNR